MMRHGKDAKPLVGRKRMALALSSALLIGLVTATTASYTDHANVNLGGAHGGIGMSERFDIAVILPDGTVEQADNQDGYNWPIDGADTLIPGSTIHTEIPIFNNTPRAIAETSFSVQLLNDDGSVGEAPNIIEFLRFTARVDGKEVFSSVPWEEAHGAIGNLEPRNASALSAGDPYKAGSHGSERKLTLEIKYVDDPRTVDYNGGATALKVNISSISGKQ